MKMSWWDRIDEKRTSLYKEGYVEGALLAPSFKAFGKDPLNFPMARQLAFHTAVSASQLLPVVALGISYNDPVWKDSSFRRGVLDKLEREIQWVGLAFFSKDFPTFWGLRGKSSPSTTWNLHVRTEMPYLFQWAVVQHDSVRAHEAKQYLEAEAERAAKLKAIGQFGSSK